MSVGLNWYFFVCQRGVGRPLLSSLLIWLSIFVLIQPPYALNELTNTRVSLFLVNGFLLPLPLPSYSFFAASCPPFSPTRSFTGTLMQSGWLTRVNYTLHYPWTSPTHCSHNSSGGGGWEGDREERERLYGVYHTAILFTTISVRPCQVFQEFVKALVVGGCLDCLGGGRRWGEGLLLQGSPLTRKQGELLCEALNLGL